MASYRIQPCWPPRASRHTLTPQMTRSIGLPPRAGLNWFRLVHWQLHCGWMFLGPVGLSLSWGQGPGLLNPQVRSQRKEQARDGLLGSSVSWVGSKVWEEGRRGSWKNLWLPWRHSTPQSRHWSTVLQLGTHFILEWLSPRGGSLSWPNRKKEFNSVVRDLESLRLAALLKLISLLSMEKDLKRQITVRDVWFKERF